MSAGLGIGVRSGRGIVVRPEVGVLFNPGETGFAWTFGVGISIRPR